LIYDINIKKEEEFSITHSALQNAASVAAMFLTTEAVIADKPEENAPMMPDIGGMM